MSGCSVPTARSPRWLRRPDAAPRRTTHQRHHHLDDRTTHARRARRPTLREAAEQAGRPHDAVRVAASLPVSVTDQVDNARAHAAEQFAIHGRLPSYRAMLDREGYPGPQDAAVIGDEKTVTTHRRPARRRRRRVRRATLRPLRRRPRPHLRAPPWLPIQPAREVESMSGVGAQSVGQRFPPPVMPVRGSPSTPTMLPVLVSARILLMPSYAEPW
jgi:hypothetical protein